jgi:protein ImuB
MEAVRALARDVTGHVPQLGIAEGLFAVELAARQSVIVPAGGTPTFCRAQPLSVLGRKDLVTTCRRLGIYTVGAFADLAPARVAERFSGPVRVLHRVARGELSEMPSQRDQRLVARLRTARGEGVVLDEQQGFFGQRSAGDERAQAAVSRVRHRLGVEGVLVADVRGGRSPDERAVLVPWGSPRVGKRDDAPWPGQLGAPAPTASLRHPVALDVVDEYDQLVRLSARGLLSAPPASLVFSRGARRRITWSAGPWPLVERWWSTPRRRAYVQILLESGEAMLLTTESGRWWLTGIYD